MRVSSVAICDLLFFLLPILSVVLAGAAAESKVFMPQQSLENAALLNRNDWTIGNEAKVVNDRIMLTSGIAGTTGQLWSKTEMQTNSFEVEFSFQITSPKIEAKPYTQRTEGFALWFSPYPLSALMVMYKNEAWNFFGHSDTFSGFGAFFKLHDRGDKMKPSISASYTAEKQHWNPVTDVPTNFGVYWMIADVKEAMNFKLIVQPDVIIGNAKFANSAKWTETFKLNATVPISGYLGFSGDAGRAEPPVAGSGVEIAIWNIRTFNTKLTEEKPAAASANEVVANLSAVGRDDVETKEQLKSISQAMSRMESQVTVRQNEIVRGLQIIEKRLDNLSADMEGIQTFLGAPHPHHAEIQTIASQVSSLKNLFQAHYQYQAKATEKLIEVGKTMHEKGEAAQDRHLDKIQSHLVKHATVNWIMVLLLMGVTFTVVGIVWRKTKEMEKNHLF